MRRVRIISAVQAENNFMQRNPFLTVLILLVFCTGIALGGEQAPADKPEKPGPDSAKKDKPGPEKPKTLPELLAGFTEKTSWKYQEMYEELVLHVPRIAEHMDGGGKAEDLYLPGGPAARIVYVKSRGARFSFAVAMQFENNLSAKTRAVMLTLGASAALLDNQNTRSLLLASGSKEFPLVIAAFNALAAGGYDAAGQAEVLLASDTPAVVIAAARYLLEKGNKEGIETLVARLVKAAESGDFSIFSEFQRALHGLTGAMIYASEGKAADKASMTAAAKKWKEWLVQNNAKPRADWLEDGYLAAKKLAIGTEPEDITRGLSHFILIGRDLDEKTKTMARGMCLRLNLLDPDLKWLRVKAMYALGDPSAADFAANLLKPGISEARNKEIIEMVAKGVPFVREIYERVLDDKMGFVTAERGADLLAARYLADNHAWQAVPLLLACLGSNNSDMRRRALGMVENHFDTLVPLPWRDPGHEERLAAAVAEWITTNKEGGGFTWYKPTQKWLPQELPYVPGYEPEEEKKKKEEGEKEKGPEEPGEKKKQAPEKDEG
jgi:hypothetical protein